MDRLQTTPDSRDTRDPILISRLCNRGNSPSTNRKQTIEEVFFQSFDPVAAWRFLSLAILLVSAFFCDWEGGQNAFETSNVNSQSVMFS